MKVKKFGRLNRDRAFRSKVGVKKDDQIDASRCKMLKE